MFPLPLESLDGLKLPEVSAAAASPAAAPAAAPSAAAAVAPEPEAAPAAAPAAAAASFAAVDAGRAKRAQLAQARGVPSLHALPEPVIQPRFATWHHRSAGRPCTVFSRQQSITSCLDIHASLYSLHVTGKEHRSKASVKRWHLCPLRRRSRWQRARRRSLPYRRCWRQTAARHAPRRRRPSALPPERPAPPPMAPPSSSALHPPDAEVLKPGPNTCCALHKVTVYQATYLGSEKCRGPPRLTNLQHAVATTPVNA